MKKISLLIVLAAFGFACNNQANTPPSNPPTTPTSVSQTPPTAPTTPPVAANTEEKIVAKINGVAITDAEITDRVKDRLQKVEAQIYDIKKGGLDDMIEEKLLEAEASKKKMSVDELLKAEVESKVEEPTESEIDTFYEMYKKKFQNKPLSEVKKDLVAQIKNTKKSTAYNKFIASLKKEAKVEILIKRPRIQVDVADAPSKGNPKAPIQIIEFSEFQCPFCKKARPVVQQIMDTYKDKVFYAFRDFPLSFHKQARKASVAAHCAGEQGKYWEYNTLLFENQGEQDPDNLKKFAKDMGLNDKKFASCLESDKYEKLIDRNIADGSKAGVSGTPAYFINGIFVSGAQPFEKFKDIIDEELENAQ